MTDPALKPCPFCNGEAWLDADRGRTMSGHYTAVVRCESCENVGTDVKFGRTPVEAAQEATAAWNRRADGWRPIAETVDRSIPPWDGNPVLLYRFACGWKVRGTGYWTEVAGIGGWIAQGISDPPGNLGLAHPTHWHPLPSPPTEAGDAE